MYYKWRKIKASTTSKVVLLFKRKATLVVQDKLGLLVFNKTPYLPSMSKSGESGWFSGHQPCLPPLRPRFNSGLEVVCGLSFSRSQSDSEGFSPGTPVFLPPQNRLPAYSIRLWCCAPRSYMGRVQGQSA